MKMLIGKKIGMTNIFSEKGRFIPVTLVKSGDNFVTQIRTEEKDGYTALQIGFEESRNVKKPQEIQLKNAKLPKLKNLREVRIEEKDLPKYKVGEKISINIFKEGEEVNVIGVSKGKGFQGVIKRHNFHRGPMSHGSDHHREPGSIGAAYPQHVFKGTKLPGRMGHDQVTVKNLKIEKIEPEENLIYIHGAIPGPNKGLILIKGEGLMYHEAEEHDLAKEKAEHDRKEAEKQKHKQEEEKEAEAQAKSLIGEKPKEEDPTSKDKK